MNDLTICSALSHANYSGVYRRSQQFCRYIANRLPIIILFICATLTTPLHGTEVIDEEPANETPSSVQTLEDFPGKQTEVLLKLEETYLAEPGVTPQPQTNPTVDAETVVDSGISVTIPHQPQEPFELLNDAVPAGAMKTLRWSPQNLFEGIPTPTPVLVANGINRGPVMCITGAIHGDEINSIETIRRVMHSIDPQELSGTVVGIPIVNQMGFRRNSRYLPDRRDLNRYFPGTPGGSSASRIAYSLFQQVIKKCNALVDLHTGSFNRTNIPQLRADLSNDSIKALTQQFGDIVVLHSEGSVGTLRREAAQIGIPTVTVEAGEAMRIQEDVIENGVQQFNTLLTNLKMLKRPFFWSNPQPVYMASRWLRAETGGIFISNHQPGDKVKKGEVLGKITDPITNIEITVEAEFAGRIIGMALNQVVLPGYAIYHVGIDASAIHKQLEQIEANRQQLGEQNPEPTPAVELKPEPEPEPEDIDHESSALSLDSNSDS